MNDILFPTVINTRPFLRTTRDFPPDPEQLRVQLNKAYLEIANAMNERIIGFYTTNQPSITGEAYYLTPQRQQTLRQIFSFTTTTTAIDHNINVIQIDQFTNCYGSWTDGTNCYGLIFGSSGAIPNQISFYLTTTQIIFVVDGGAPALTSGRIVLEWLSQT